MPAGGKGVGAVTGLDPGCTSKTAVTDKLSDPNLFKNNPPGVYTYSSHDRGKQATGQLCLCEGKRNPQAQLEAGGDARLPDDEGGHLIATRFCGSGGSENIDAQNHDVNCKGFIRREYNWANLLKGGCKIYVEISTYKPMTSDRPEAVFGFAIIETKDGKRYIDPFSYTNTSYKEQGEWDMELETYAKEQGMDGAFRIEDRFPGMDAAEISAVLDEDF